MFANMRRAVENLPSPQQLRRELPASAAMLGVVARARAEICSILRGTDDRLLVVVGPCSIHDLASAREYAGRLAKLRDEHARELLICMRSYFEKPRTSVGWKGFLHDPRLDGSCDLAAGLHLSRSLLCDLLERGLPVALESLDPLAPSYFAELVSWTAIGARTTESQTHRELASGLGMPVGFKNSTDGDVRAAVHAMRAAAHGHTMLGIDEQGRSCVVRTEGNPHTHVILRGGRSGPNHAAADVAQALAKLREARLTPHLMIDCSHDNSGHDHRHQLGVAESIAAQVSDGAGIIGAMIESHLVAGKQSLGGELMYGQSVSDACVDFATTELMLAKLARAVRKRREGARFAALSNVVESASQGA